MVTVAHHGDLSVTEVAVNFGTAKVTVRRRMKQADDHAGIKEAS